MGIAVVPVYLSILGLEGYGLIGLFAALQAILSVFDFGLGTTLTRQMAIDSRSAARAASLADFTRSVEWVYWGAAALLTAVWIVVSPLVASGWINADHTAMPVAARAIVLMGIAAGMQFPFALYGGGLLGLQRQVTYNLLLSGFGAARAVGAILVLQLVSPTIVAFFVWQVVVSVLQSATAAVLLWRGLPRASRPPKFELDALRVVWRFAAGTGGTSVLSVLRSQVDKILLSRFLRLSDFGNYSLAATLGSSVYFLGTPFFMAYFPRFSEILADGKDVSPSYHEAAQLLSTVLVPASIVAAVFAQQVLFAWTGNEGIAASTSTIASLLIMGFAFAALSGIPYTLQLAAGWSRLALDVSLASLIVAIPLISFGAIRFGAIGAAAAWLFTSVGYTVGLVALMHRRLLVNEQTQWYFVDVGLPTLASLLVAAAGRYLTPVSSNRGAILLQIAAVSVAAVAASIVATPSPRRIVFALLQRSVGRARA